MLCRALGWVLLTPLFLACGSEERNTFEYCENSAECIAPADDCWEVELERLDGSMGRSSICSHECSTDGDCGDGTCLALVGDPSAIYLCYARCGVGVQCAVGTRCTELQDAPAGSEYACLP
jgi:hypothetical protein